MLRTENACTFLTSSILTQKCAWRHNDVHLFNIKTCKNGLNISCFYVYIFCLLTVEYASSLSVQLLLLSKSTSRNSRMHFWSISTSKNAPAMVHLARFDFETCFAPQPCTPFPHLNLQKCSEHSRVHLFDLTSDGSAPATLASLLFDAPEHKNIREKILVCDFSIFSRALIFFLRNLSLLTSLLWLLSRLLFNLSILSEV